MSGQGRAVDSVRGNRRAWFLRFLGRSLLQRKGRVLVASASVMLAAAIIICSLGISAGIGQRLGGELKAYGANVIVTSAAGSIGQEDYALIAGLGGVEDLTGQLYATLEISGAKATGSKVANRQVELMGLQMDKLQARGWKITGRWPGTGEVLAGADIALALGLEPGGTLNIISETGESEMPGDTIALAVSGTVERGGPEDGALLMPLGDARALLKAPGALSSVLVRAGPGRAEDVALEIRRALPHLRAKTLRQVAGPEKDFLGKMQLLMLLVALVVLVATGICVGSTMNATVLERLEEIGLMKALGGTRREIGMFFFAESMAIGTAGGAMGCLVGYLAAQAVSRGAFGASVSIPFYVFVTALGASLAIAVASSVVPVGGSLRRGASDILRGG